MRIEKFEDIIAWQKARELTIGIYSHFQNSRDFGFRDQIQRASVSIMNNIAEGFDRRGNKEFARYLYISKASCSEVRSMIYLAKDLKYISEEKFKNFHNKSIEISKLLSGFLKSIKV